MTTRDDTGTIAWASNALRRWWLGVLVLSIALLPGCAVGPDYIAPEPDVPDAWFQSATAGIMEGESNINTWWTLLEDPTLNDLIQRSSTGNLDLQAAFTRIKQARAIRGIATGERYPDLNSSGIAQRQETRDFGFGDSVTDNFYDIGLDASWEIDVWGRISRRIESADAQLDASIEEYRDVLVILYADIALNYVALRATQARIDYAESNIKTQEATLKLTEDRLRAQLAPELDVEQAKLNLSITESALPVFREDEQRLIHRLSVLLGEYPGALYDLLAPRGPIPAPPAQTSIGFPYDAVRQRPDIRAVERLLASQTAEIGVATADLYPRFSLSGTFAFSGTSDLFDKSNRNWSIGPAVQWNLFDGGRLRNNIILQEEIAEELLVRYEQTVLFALEDVENALVAYREEQVRRDALRRSVDAAQKSVDLVTQLYKSGLTDFQNVQNTERDLFVQQDELADSEGRVTQSIVALYRALGGGWEPDPPQLQAEIADQQENGEPMF